MPDFHIYIGYRTVSSWSLRGWLPLKKTGAPFEETLIRYRTPRGQGAARRRFRRPARCRSSSTGATAARSRSGTRSRSANISPSSSRRRGCGRRTRWRAPSPARSRRRCIPASGRSASICRWRSSSGIPKPQQPAGATPTSPASRRSGASAARRWGKTGGGPFLFGHFTIADAMYAPVVTRFRTYGASSTPTGTAYMEAVLTDPDFRAWEDQAKSDPPPEPPTD